MDRINNGSETTGGVSSSGNIASGSPIITNVPSIDTANINIGDYCIVAPFYTSVLPSAYRIIAVGATTITLEVNAGATTAVTFVTINGMATDGIPSVVGRTTISSEDFNKIQEEILLVIKQSGATPSQGELNQLVQTLVLRDLTDTYTNIPDGEVRTPTIEGEQFNGTPGIKRNLHIKSGYNFNNGLREGDIYSDQNHIFSNNLTVDEISETTSSAGIKLNNKTIHENQAQHKYPDALKGASEFDFNYMKSIKFFLNTNTNLLADTTYTIINGIPGLTDSHRALSLIILGKQDSFVGTFGSVQFIGSLNLPTTNNYYTYGQISQDSTLCMDVNQSVNQVALPTGIVRGGFAIQKIGADDYDLVLFTAASNDFKRVDVTIELRYW